MSHDVRNAHSFKDFAAINKMQCKVLPDLDEDVVKDQASPS